MSNFFEPNNIKNNVLITKQKLEDIQAQRTTTIDEKAPLLTKKITHLLCLIPLVPLLNQLIVECEQWIAQSKQQIKQTEQMNHRLSWLYHLYFIHSISIYYKNQAHVFSSQTWNKSHTVVTPSKQKETFFSQYPVTAHSTQIRLYWLFLLLMIQHHSACTYHHHINTELTQLYRLRKHLLQEKGQCWGELNHLLKWWKAKETLFDNFGKDLEIGLSNLNTEIHYTPDPIEFQKLIAQKTLLEDCQHLIHFLQRKVPTPPTRQQMENLIKLTHSKMLSGTKNAYLTQSLQALPLSLSALNFIDEEAVIEKLTLMKHQLQLLSYSKGLIEFTQQLEKQASSLNKITNEEATKRLKEIEEALPIIEKSNDAQGLAASLKSEKRELKKIKAQLRTEKGIISQMPAFFHKSNKTRNALQEEYNIFIPFYIENINFINCNEKKSYDVQTQEQSKQFLTA